MRVIIFVILHLTVLSCTTNNDKNNFLLVKTNYPLFPHIDIEFINHYRDSLHKDGIIKKLKEDDFINLRWLNKGFKWDLKYATNDNFIDTAIYPCGECFLRYKVAKALIKANLSLKEKGFYIILYDCYRPLSVQKAMWKIFPNPTYLANPKKGSYHNRGTAVDIGLVDSLGNIVDMGTDFDFFGRKAHHTYLNLPPEILENRKLLKTTMQKNGFFPTRTEWWHYNFNNSKKLPLADFPIICE